MTHLERPDGSRIWLDAPPELIAILVSKGWKVISDD